MINYSLVKRYSKVGDETSEVLTYGTAQTVKTMSLMEFAKHIAEHGSVYGRSDIQAILIQAVDCLREQLLNGMKVNLGDLGDFSISLRGKGVKDAKNYNPKSQVTEIRVIWTPGNVFNNLVEDAEYCLVPTLKDRAKLLKAIKTGQTIVDLSDDDPTDTDSTDNQGGNPSTGPGQDNSGSDGNDGSDENVGGITGGSDNGGSTAGNNGGSGGNDGGGDGGESGDAE